jgi:hypothetical protein
MFAYFIASCSYKMSQFPINEGLIASGGSTALAVLNNTN